VSKYLRYYNVLSVEDMQTLAVEDVLSVNCEQSVGKGIVLQSIPLMVITGPVSVPALLPRCAVLLSDPFSLLMG